MEACESCKGTSNSLLGIRDGLDYWICKSCYHCVKVVGDRDAEFHIAQSRYFGDDSPLLTDQPSQIDREVLSRRRRLARRFFARGARVIEVGPGSGHFASWLVEKGYDVTLVEYSEALAQGLRRRLNAQVEVGEFENFSERVEGVDVFCSLQVIEHVPDPVRHLQAGLHAVRAGGLGFVATPNSRSWEQRIFCELSPNFDSAHLRVFSPASLHAACTQAGWQVLAVQTPEYTSAWFRILSKLVRKFRHENEEETAGKYANIKSLPFMAVYNTIRIISIPMRIIQELRGAGNEIVVILRRPVEQGS